MQLKEFKLSEPNKDLSFRLDQEFIDQYKDKPVSWGPLGEFTYLRTYSRKREDGSKEKWHETVQRVVDGAFSIQKKHCHSLHLKWDQRKATKSAKIMYDKIFNFKFLPPGRGLWVMGTKFVEEKGSAALNNCAFISTKDISVRGSFAFGWTMDALMLGVGVGFDALGADQMTIREPKKTEKSIYVIPDTREGWVESFNIVIDAFFHGKELPQMDYSSIRKYGEPIKGFGGVASGPEPLKVLHESVTNLLTKRIGLKITSVDIVDIMNMIGKCVIAGNVRRCLPGEAMVHTKNGMVPIEKIEIGEEVLTHNGYKPVVNKFEQGEQETVVVKTVDGVFECTPNHRIAILDGVESFVWVEAQNIQPGDRMITTTDMVEGADVSLPPFTRVKPEHSTTCKEITIPELDEDFAWFLGSLHANGYVYNRNEHGNRASSHISMVVGLDKLNVAEKFANQIRRFNIEPTLNKRKNENSYIVKAHSQELVEYLGMFKKANTSIEIPDFIWKSRPNIRLAYVAGVMDGDGCVKNRPVKVLSSVYPQFVHAIQSLLYSCGVSSCMSFSETENLKRIAKGWQALYSLAIINQNAHEKLGGFLVNKMSEKTRYQRTNSFPVEWVSDVLTPKQKSESGAYGNENITVERINQYIAEDIKFIPVEVVSVESGRVVETYDIEVEENHNFFCDGYLTHNSAEIAIGDWQDKEYTSMKDYNLFPEELMSHRWASNNSVFAEVGKTDYAKFIDNIAVNGEPGLIWLENMQKYSRTIDPPDWKDKNAAGTNPCKPLYSKILTDNGYITFEQALEMPKLNVVIGGKTVEATSPFKTGDNRVIYSIKLSNGSHLYGTEDHLHQIVGGHWKRMDELVIGDHLLYEVTSIHDNMDVASQEEYNNGILTGWLWGDGSLSHRSDHPGYNFSLAFGINEFDVIPMFEEVFGIKTVPHHQKPDTCRTFGSHKKSYAEKVLNYGYNIDKSNLEWLYKTTKDFKIGFIKAAFTTDGSVRPGNNCVELYSIHQKALEVLSDIFREFGVYTNITTHSIAKSYITKDGKQRNNKQMFKLVVYSNSFSKFGFLSKFKQDLLSKIVDKPARVPKDYVVVMDIDSEYDIQDVYDISVDSEEHSFIDSGVVTHNCGEQTLESGELCCLVETFPSLHSDLDEYKETLKYAYMYAKSVTLLPTHWPETNAILLKNRRIGLSQSGIIDSFVKHGRHNMLTNWCDKGFSFVQELDQVYSDWLCVPRSKKTTTVKPSGSVSLLSGVSPGIHYPHSEYYIRRIRVDSDDPLVQIMKDAGYYVCYDVYGATKEEKEKTSVVHFPVHETNFSKRKDDVSIWEQVKNTVDYQRYWADNNVSVTVTFKKDEAKDILPVLEAFESELKSISFLPISEHGYQLAPYEEITKEQYDEMVSKITNINYSSLFLPAAKGSKFCDSDSCEI